MAYASTLADCVGLLMAFQSSSLRTTKLPNLPIPNFLAAEIVSGEGSTTSNVSGLGYSWK